MFKWLKLCDHDWKEVRYGSVETERGHTLTVHLFCPKCDKKKFEFASRWEEKKRIDAIKRDYDRRR